jgi:hypothetical protein
MPHVEACLGVFEYEGRIFAAYGDGVVHRFEDITDRFEEKVKGGEQA